MKLKFTYLLLLILLAGCSSEEPTPEPVPIPEPVPEVVVEKIYEGSVALETQQELDQFGEEGYTVVTGDLWIGKPHSESSILNTWKLENLRKVGGYLYIEGTSLETLKGLKNLDTVSGELHISNNHKLRSLEGLDDLKHITSHFQVHSNNNLASLKGLKDLGDTYSFTIANNPKLTSLAGLEAFDSFKWYAYILNNSELDDYCVLKPLLETHDFEVNIEGNYADYTKADILNGNCNPH